jgi:hypothetical protein
MSGCRKGAPALVRELARQETPEAVEALVEIMRDEEAPSAARLAPQRGS